MVFTNLKSCKNCIYCKGAGTEESRANVVCERFYRPDVIYGDRKLTCDEARQDETSCGVEAKGFHAIYSKDSVQKDIQENIDKEYAKYDSAKERFEKILQEKYSGKVTLKEDEENGGVGIWYKGERLNTLWMIGEMEELTEHYGNTIEESVFQFMLGQIAAEVANKEIGVMLKEK